LSLGIDSTAIFVGSSVDTFGGIVNFSSEGDAGTVQELLKKRPYIWSHTSNRSIALVAGQDAWAQSLRSALENTDKAPLELKYPDVSEIIKLLPENPPSQPIAAGFLRISGLPLEALGTKGNIGLGNVSKAFSSIRAKDVAFAVYSDKKIVQVPASINENFFREAGVGAVYVTRSGYPGIVVSLALNTLGGSAGLVKTSIGDLSVRYMKVQDLHAFIVNRGSVLFAAIAPDKDYAEKFIVSAVK
jgi:hypothetical protein